MSRKDASSRANPVDAKRLAQSEFVTRAKAAVQAKSRSRFALARE
jgi:hypothetical protein